MNKTINKLIYKLKLHSVLYTQIYCNTFMGSKLESRERVVFPVSSFLNVEKHTTPLSTYSDVIWQEQANGNRMIP